VRRVGLGARELFALQQFIAPVGYSGPLNVDLRRRASGEIAVLEINPRLGGSLFKDFAQADLTDVLGAIAHYAVWRDPERMRWREAA
jgi:hypothetical protein